MLEFSLIMKYHSYCACFLLQIHIFFINQDLVVGSCVENSYHLYFEFRIYVISYLKVMICRSRESAVMAMARNLAHSLDVFEFSKYIFLCD